MDVKSLWGNSNFDFVTGDSLGNSGGILCIWEASIFKKDGATISDNFIAIYGTWLPRNVKILLVAVYAPQQPGSKRALWDFLSNLVRRWNGEAIIMGDFNDVRTMDERLGSSFNVSSARCFDRFIVSSGLVDVKLEGYSFTWSHPSASKMSKLDRFLVTEGIISLYPSISALCLDRHLSDHRPILLREVLSDFGPTPFRFYQSWLRMEGFDSMVEHAWLSFSHSDSNAMVRFKKKLQDLKSIIRLWVKDKKFHLHNAKNSLQNDLISIDKDLERGNVSDDILLNRMDLNRRLQDIKLLEVKDLVQKSKIKWAIEGDENSKFFHGIINKKRSQLSIRGVFVEGTWCTDPSIVKEAFKNHFEVRFQQPCHDRLKLNAPFHNRLSSDQVDELDRAVSRDEIRRAVWNCGENKSPGPDGYTFEFFRKYWSLVGADFCDAVDYFFKSGTFPRGCNSSFIALIPKVNDAKFVNDFRPISLIGCVYKVITKVLANRLATVISDLVSETQSAFVANRQILDGPFILNEMLNWCKRKKKQAMFFKVDFAKAYDSVRWDYLLDILHAFGFGPNWCRWIRGTFTSSMASILVNGSPTSEFPFCCGLKQGDPLAPYLFILIMESLHISFSRVVDDGLFKGFQLHGSVNISHLFYADDAMFIGEWSEQNLHNIVKVLNCFHLASGLKINIAKSQVLGVGVSQNVVVQAANRIGCAVLNTPFRYLGVTVGECMSRKSAWVGLVNKLQARLSKWKVKTLSIGGRLTLLKSVLGASPIYYMSIFKVPKGVLKTMESIRSKFFNGVDSSDRKISWVAWDNVLASKLNGGLGVSSFFALNRALLLKWVWRFISGDGSLWCKVIQAIYGSKFDLHVTDQPLIWCSTANDAVLRNMQNQGQNLQSQMANLTDMLSKFVTANTASTSGSGTLPGNTVTNPKEDLKGITTRSGVTIQGPKACNHDTEVTKDTMPPANNGSTEDVQPPVVQIQTRNPNPEPNVAPVVTPVPKASIPFPSRRNDERRKEKANDQIEKFYEIFRDLSFEISFTDALMLMPKFASTLKTLIGNKEKLSELARTPLNENCSAVILNKLPKKLGDPGRFLIPCEFTGITTCNALADLGASINLMPYSVWKSLSLSELTPTCMTLELADRSITEPIGIAEDVFINVGKFQFPADFVVVDFEPDPRVPLILGRCFLKTSHALIDVYEGEITLRVGKEAITFNLDQTSKYTADYNHMTVNKIDVIDMACDEYSQEVLGFSSVVVLKRSWVFQRDREWQSHSIF
ncbi:RNA-directed DNA polymerase, eukaryota [Tanacetum coccineum]